MTSLRCSGPSQCTNQCITSKKKLHLQFWAATFRGQTLILWTSRQAWSPFWVLLGRATPQGLKHLMRQTGCKKQARVWLYQCPPQGTEDHNWGPWQDHQHGLHCKKLCKCVLCHHRTLRHPPRQPSPPCLQDLHQNNQLCQASWFHLLVRRHAQKRPAAAINLLNMLHQVLAQLASFFTNLVNYNLIEHGDNGIKLIIALIQKIVKCQTPTSQSLTIHGVRGIRRRVRA